jgi:hypothetical protein
MMVAAPRIGRSDRAAGELIRALTLNPHIDYQPIGAHKGPALRPPK